MDYEKHMGLTLLQMNFILGASSMDRVSRVILASMAIPCGSSSPPTNFSECLLFSANTRLISCFGSRLLIPEAIGCFLKLLPKGRDICKRVAPLVSQGGTVTQDSTSEEPKPSKKPSEAHL